MRSKQNDEEAEFTEGDSDSGQACAGDDIRNCMHVYTASPPIMGGRERKKPPKGAPLTNSGERRKRKSAVAAQQKFKELFKNNGDTSEDEGRAANEHQPTEFPSPRRRVMTMTGSDCKAKRRDFTALTTAETGDSKQSSRSNRRRRIIAHDEVDSNGEEEWQQEEEEDDDGAGKNDDGEEEEEKDEDKDMDEEEEEEVQPRRVSRRQKQSVRSEAALQELKKRRGQSSLEVTLSPPLHTHTGNLFTVCFTVLLTT